MNVTSYTPSDFLKPFVKSFLVIECREERVNRVLPDTSLVMAFRYKGVVYNPEGDAKQKLSATVVSGLRNSSRLIHYSNNAGNILVLFKEASAHAFIKEPLHELFGNSIPLDNLAGYRQLSVLEEQLSEKTNNRQRIDLIEQFLISKCFYPKHDNLILSATDRIRSSKGNIRIKELAASHNISIDPFEKRFRNIVGISPKQFSNIIRLKSVISSGLKKNELASSAYEAGYFDQAHFNKDFKLFTGQTPTDFLKSPVSW
jgi:AraC-like DNA-binding protein